MNGRNDMKTPTKVLLALTFAGFSLAAVPAAFSQATSTAKPAAKAPAESSSHFGEGFPTPQAAVDALIQAAADYDRPKLAAIFGPESDSILTIADPVQAKNRATEFSTTAKQKNKLKADPKNPNRDILLIGDDDWPMPIPLVKRGAKWYFDTHAGLNELLARRIGANELDAITICRGYVDAQLEYASEAHGDSGLKQYAQKIISTPGTHDGLAWKNDDGSWGGPIGEKIANAIAQGYSGTGKVEPYHGYYFKILKGQGPAAPLGQLDYVIQGAMIGGFALVAAPAEYGSTGIQTFMVSYNGVVYQKDLGPDTLKIVKAMDRYNPDKTWKRTDDEW